MESGAGLSQRFLSAISLSENLADPERVSECNRDLSATIKMQVIGLTDAVLETSVRYLWLGNLMLRVMRFACLLTPIIASTIGFAENKEKEAAELMHRAKQLSDIRAEGSLPFRLKASIKLTAEDGSVSEGAYIENWVSPEMWRTEVVAGALNETEVAMGRKLSVLSTSPLLTDFISPRITAAHEHLLAFRLDGNWFQLDWRPSKIEDRTSASWSLRCISVNNPFGWTQEFCFDRSNGLLLVRSSTKKDAPYACTYLDFQKFGDKLYPRTIQCLRNGRPALQAALTELTKLESPNPALFGPLPNARELSHCPHVGVPAQVRVADMMSFHLQSQEPIELLFIVGADAKPRNAMLSHSGGIESEDKQAVNSLKHWSFKSATCDGIPVDSEMSIIVPNIAAHGVDTGVYPRTLK
jgi:hypothetical protein